MQKLLHSIRISGCVRDNLCNYREIINVFGKTNYAL